MQLDDDPTEIVLALCVVEGQFSSTLAVECAVVHAAVTVFEGFATEAMVVFEVFFCVPLPSRFFAPIQRRK